MKHSYSNDDTCFSINVIDEILEEDFDALLYEGSKILHSIKGTLLEEEIFAEFDKFMTMTVDENFDSESDTEEPPFDKITINIDYKIKTTLEEPPTDLELKPLPDNLEYVFLEEPSFLPVIISYQLSKEKKNKLISVLRLENNRIPGAVLGQKDVFAFDKFRSYLILSKTTVHTDHSALRHLFKNQDAKPCLIRRILLLQEFDIEIKDRKGTENVAADHLSRLENDETSDDSEVDDNFPGETLMEINTKNEPWFTDFVNYLVVAVDYVSKWAEAQALPTNDARVLITFLKKLFCHFRMPKALISDRGTHFCNKIMEKTMKRYGVNNRFSTSYHPQTSGQVENMNMALKRILEKTVKDNYAIWSRKLEDAPWAFSYCPTKHLSVTVHALQTHIWKKLPTLPFEIKHRAYWALKNCNPDLIAAGEKRMFQLHEFR
ncbi:reverse transcriptase domain-containing protein [Tanacetum coccineum]